MSKYINADELKQQMIKYGWKHPDSTVHEFVDDMPSADVRENTHGHWIDYDDDYGSLMCSICEEDAPDDIPWDFCPHCGADMRQGDNDV